MKKLILGIDGGGYEVKVAGPFGAISFKSNLAPYFKPKVDEEHGDDDMVFEIDNRKGFAGTIAKNDNRLGGKNRLGITKAHQDAKIRILLGIYRYLKTYDLEPSTISIVVGQPYDGHNEADKQAIKDMLKGPHPIIVNDEAITIRIGEIGVAPEGTAAFWSGNQAYPNGKVMDFGSGTINLISFFELKVLASGSKTLDYGAETPDYSHEQITDAAINETISKGWQKDSNVLVCGGIAGKITKIVQQEYPKAEVLIPTLVLDDGNKQILEPKFANAVGNYNIAKGSFK